MTSVRILRKAKDELEAAASHYEAQRIGLGTALLLAARRSLAQIQERPLSSPKERGDIRVRSVRGFPYRIYYTVRHDEVVIIAITHRRRRPGYWRQRSTR
jgi:plasmid stabilization system protein ParE